MVKFKQAVEWMKEGKKVRRPDFNNDEYIALFDGTIPKFINMNNNEKEYFTFDYMDFEATDWEIYQEEDNWSPIIYHIKYESKYDDGDRNYYEKEEGNFITEEDFNKLYNILKKDFASLSVDLGYGNRMLQPVYNKLKRRFNKE